MTPRPIVLIDDDPDDIEMMQDAIKEIDPGREVIAFSEPYQFLEFVRTTEKVFLFILSDINMSKLNGLQLKKLIFDDERLRMKCVPFIFFSTTSLASSIEIAYSYNVQGFFVKPNSIDEIKDLFQTMIAYWSASERPNQGKSAKD